MYTVLSQQPQEVSSRSPQVYKISGCSSSLYKMAQHLHITYICIQTAAGYAYTSLHCRDSVQYSVHGKFKFCFLEIPMFFFFFRKNVFSVVGCILRCKIHGYVGLYRLAYINKYIHLCIYVCILSLNNYHVLSCHYLLFFCF